MAIKTILACLIDLETADDVMTCAVSLARSHDAHLTVLHTLASLVVYPGVAMHVPHEAFAIFNDNQHKEAAEIEAVFRKHTENEDIAAEWRLLPAGASTPADRITDSARMADLVIMPNATTAKDQSQQVQSRVIQDCGRPVLVVPSNYTAETIGSNIVVGWSDTREATRAAHDLVPVAIHGAAVSVLRVYDKGLNPLDDSELVELATAYDRHGLHAQIVHRDRQGKDVADILLEFAFEDGADLIATGAFGHSRAYDFVIGAVTYGLLRDARIPVLFSH